MSHSFDYRPLINEQEKQHVKALDAQCFLTSERDADTYFEQVGAEHVRAIYQNNQMLGGLVILPMRQCWHGQWVPMAGIASVGIAPEHRGNGSAIALLRSTMQELYEAKFAVSVLYPATQRLYRKAGYEQGGTRCKWEIQTEHIRITERSLPITPMAPEVEQLTPIYAEYALAHNGLCDRHHSMWLYTIRPRSNETVYAYRIGTESHPQGYIVFTQNRERGRGMLTIRDWTATTIEAAQTLWGFLFAHRSQIDCIRWHSGAFDAMLPLLPEQSARMIDRELWMLRIVNVPLALESRGYPSAVNAELHLHVNDDMLAANTGSFILTLSNGQGSVRAGGGGDLKMSIQGLASLYSGLHTPEHLRWMGWLEGTDESVAIATQIFAGAPPWISDFF